MVAEPPVKRLTLCLFTVCAAIAIAAPAASALFQLDYNGHLRHETNSYVGFNVKHTSSGKRRATFFTSRGLPFSCDTGSSGTTQFLTLHDSLPIVKGRFEGKSHVFTPQGDPVARVHGSLSGGSAHGRLRLTGKLDPADPSASCDTGRRRWVAQRGPQPAS
jgi:hypothetical protein